MRKVRKKLLAETFDYSKYEGEFKGIKPVVDVKRYLNV